MKKGQLTIEYLIILVAMLLLFSNISLDLLDFSLRNTVEIQTSEFIRSSDNLLNYSINSISLQGAGAKKSVYLRPPSDCDYLVNPHDITLRCPSNTVSAPYDGTLIGRIDPLTNVAYLCPFSTSPSTCLDSKIASGVLERIEIFKNP